MLTLSVVIIAAVSGLVQCQRGSFAGTRPIGIPELLNRSTTTVDPLGNRFGEGDRTTERLPIEANGDRDLVDRISKFPIDKQPFWYLNWKALEAQRKNPQTYPQRPSHFGQTPNFNALSSNTGPQNSNPGTINANTVTGNSNTGAINSSNGTGNPNTGSVSSDNAATNSNSSVPSLGNRNGVIGTNSSIGNRTAVNTGSHGSGYGQPHNGYGT